jgi:LPXTG-site transpeptidase (sortase) family protein
MADVCPHLGLEDGSRQSLLLASQHHRCYASGEPQRVGFALQRSVCLTPAYSRCPHQGRQKRSAGRRTPRAGGLSGDGFVEGQVPAIKDPGLRSTANTQGGRSRRSVTITEGAVLGLVAAIVLACMFIGYSVYYRIQVGPGMTVAAAVAGEGESVPNQARATLVPTFTPTPLPTEPQPTAAESSALDSPTPVPEPLVPTAVPVVRLAANSPPTRLLIPEIDLDVAVVPVGVKTTGEGANARSVWGDVPNAAAFHQTTAYPGNPGNTVINGHRDIFASVFRHLDKVAVGNEIVLYVGKVAYPYSVTETLVVPETFASAKQRAENLRLIGHMPEERLTLITCTPVGLATHRLLIIAKPVEGVVPQMPEAGSEGGP